MAEDIETVRAEVMFGAKSLDSCFAHNCPPPPPRSPLVHAELSGTHHQILVLEGTNLGTLPGSFYCPSSSALRTQLEGEGVDSGEEQ